MSFITEDSPLRKLFVPNPPTERAKATKFDISRDGTKLLYCVGTNVFVKDLENPDRNEVYSQHKAKTTIARFAPNGHYIASGDESGHVRVWASDHPERLLKLETRALGGPVRDLAWDSESKRIIAVGSGATMCKAFLWDTGNSMGDMVGHTKEVNSVAIRPARPFKAVTGGEDKKVVFYNGPPFKFARSHTSHTNFVNCVAFAPDGSRFATVSSDRTGRLFDGKTGDPAGELNGHAGGVYAVAFSPGSDQVLTASGDKTCKLWDAASGELITTFAMRAAPVLGDMQCGVMWGGDRAVSLSFSGDLNVLPLGKPEGTPPAVLVGPQAATTAVAVVQESGDAVVGAADGAVFVYREGRAHRVTGGKHASKCTGVAVAGGRLYSVGFDDTLRSAPLDSLECDVAEKLEGQPLDISASAGSVVAVATSRGVAIARDGAVVSFTPFDWSPSAVGVSADGSRVAVAQSDAPHAIRLFDVDGSALSEAAVIDNCPAVVHTLAFSPDGTKLAAGDAGREVRVWDAATLAPIVEYTWIAHGSRVTSLAWKADSDHVVSGSVDASVFVWSVANPKERVSVPQAHTRGVMGVATKADGTVVSVGMDACVKEWSL